MGRLWDSLYFLSGSDDGSFASNEVTRKWAWENLGTIWTILHCFVFPLLLAYSTVPQLAALRSSRSRSRFDCGSMWSRLGNRPGSVRFSGGSNRHRSHISLLVLGLSAAVGV